MSFVIVWQPLAWLLIAVHTNTFTDLIPGFIIKIAGFLVQRPPMLPPIVKWKILWYDLVYLSKSTFNSSSTLYSFNILLNVVNNFPFDDSKTLPTKGFAEQAKKIKGIDFW